ncbi:MAG: hypothetical protein DRI57_30800 [Deltaproteobacteria bacterium]|nr:MAG: hypothetical protein DRI57_30800 [Deltaproteobacteria bacterium]
MKKKMAIAVCMMISACWFGVATAGDTEPSGPPETGSGMYPLSDIYNYLDSGTAPSISDSFQEPTEPPDSTMDSTKDIYDNISDKFNECNATPDQVLNTATFFSTDPDNWGPIMGNIESGEDVTGENGQLEISVPDGLYSGEKKITAADTALIPENIRAGETVFGQTGTFTQTETPAISSDIVRGKTAFVNGIQVDGTAEAGDDVTGENGLLEFFIPNGLYSEWKKATAADTALIPGNIKAGATIFGQTGTFTQTDSPAAASDILSGKTAFVNGVQMDGTAEAGKDVSGEDGQLEVSIPDGFYTNRRKATANDAALIPENIKAGATVFGQTGTFTQTDSPAAASDIMSGKTAFVNGVQVDGASEAGEDVSGEDGQLEIFIPDGFYSGRKKTIAGDAALTPENIKSGVAIFGVTGDAPIPSGDAVETDVRTGKIFSSASGVGITGTMPEGNNVAGNDGELTISIPNGYYEDKTADASDTNLTAENIKGGVTIFGVTGTYTGPVCSGELSAKGRWCDNEDGTVTDMTTGLTWLKKADWGTEYAFWANASDQVNALDRASSLKAGTDDADLGDGSKEGDWRLPMLKEFNTLLNGEEAVTSSEMHAFSGVQTDWYWTGTTFSSDASFAWCGSLDIGYMNSDDKTTVHWIWPVR